MCNRIYIEDIAVVKVFINEWKECLEGLEKDILRLEISTDDIELINNIIKKVHSLKNGYSFVGLSNIRNLIHEIEVTIEAVREGNVFVDNELINSLLLSIDFLNGYISHLLSKIINHDLTNGAEEISLDFENEQSADLIMENLKLTREKCNDIKHDERMVEVEDQADKELDVLQSEEFKIELAEGMKEQFLLESIEHIERIENELLIELDKNGDNRDAINDIFREIHSIKGGTGIYLSVLSDKSAIYSGLKRFSEVVHNFESLLALVRDKGSSFDKSLIDLTYNVTDYLRTFICAVDTNENIDLNETDILGKIGASVVCIETGSCYIAKKIEASPQVPVNKAENTQSKSNMTQSIRVNQEKIDNLMNNISELLIAKNSFMHIATKLNIEYNLPEISKEVKQVGAYVNRISDELQNAIMSIRMVEVRAVFQKMPRVVRDIAQSTNKKMDLIMEGESTEIDKTIIEQISDPLVHLLRNAADHGIEPPEERSMKGKNATGRIVLRAYNKSKYVYIEIEDDGKGIDANKVKEKAIEKGFITSSEAEKMSKNQLINLIFLPGFSMAKEITEVSGRGVGMDIVKSNIVKIKGNITIESEVDKGTKMIIQLPLTLAVSRGLIVEVSGDSYIFPLEYITETVKIKKEDIHTFNEKCFTHFRGEIIGVDWLSKLFLMDEGDDTIDELNAVIITNGAEKHAIFVDKLISEQEFVVKALDGQLAAIPGISGSTLLGDGRVALIINPLDIFKLTHDMNQA